MTTDRHRRARIGASLMLACSLAACGGSDDGAASSPPETSQSGAAYFPLTSDGRWVYDTSAREGLIVARVTGPQAVGDASGAALQFDDFSRHAIWRATYVLAPGAVREVPDADLPPPEQLGPIDVMRLPTRVGDSFVQADHTTDDGVPGVLLPMAVHSEVRTMAFETVTTAAGGFADCLHLRQSFSRTPLRSTSAAEDRTITVDSWYAPGIGRVKKVTTVPGGATTTETLVGFRVAGHSNDTTPPVLLSVQPAEAGVLSGNASVRASFDKPMDPYSFSLARFSVLDAKGNLLTGASGVDGNTFYYTPDQAWPAGTYTVHVGPGLTDLLGNASASERSWTFRVD